MTMAAANPQAAMRRRSFSRSKEDAPNTCEELEKAQAQAKARDERRRSSLSRFSLTGAVDLAEFANVDQRLSPEKKLQQARRAARRRWPGAARFVTRSALAGHATKHFLV